jgi:hypothetical protein
MNGWGGIRTNSGRKRKPIKILKKATAEQVLDQIGELEGWKWAWDTAKAKEDVKAAVEILAYLTNRRDGKPAQAINLGGPEGSDLEIVFSGSRPPWARNVEDVSIVTALPPGSEDEHVE